MTTARSIIVLLVIFLALVLLMSLERWSISHRSDEAQCRLRLRRLGIAVNQWVTDHQLQRFPNIVNPAPANPWQPDRLASSRSILAPYLHGDVPLMQREDESNDAFYQRQLRHELTVDPRTGLEFWYNPALRERRPDQLSGADSALWYFRSQRDAEGNWPYRHRGEDGTWVVSPSLIQRQISEQDLRAMRDRLTQLERDNAGRSPQQWTHDLDFLRQEVARIEALHREHGESSEGGARVLTQLALEEEVHFKAGEAILQGL